MRDLTSSFFTYSHNIDFPQSFILPFMTRKVITVAFSEVFVIVASCCPNTGHSSGFAG